MDFTPTEEFLTIAAEIKASPIDMTDITRLKLYGLFKQTTVGDCKEKDPWMPMTKENAMIKAWVLVKGTPREDAQAQYIAQAKSILGGGK